MASPFKRENLTASTHTKSRIGFEIEALRQKIADLESLEFELTRAELALNAAGTQPEPATADQLRREIKERLGYFPLSFAPAADIPEVLRNLWQQALAAYYDNPLPALIKEKLFVQLARYCAGPYSIVTHSCILHSLGTAASEVLRLLQQPTPSPEEDLDGIISTLSSVSPPIAAWPEPDSDLEEAFLRGCILFFLRPADAEACHVQIRRLLNTKNYEHLIGFLSYVKAFHVWLEAHPEISYHSDPQVRANIIDLLREEPRLAALFRNYYREFGIDRRRLAAEQALRASEERYRELFENANDMVYTMDFEGNLTSLNKAAERITGYSRAEALRMKLEQFVAPGHEGVVRKMLERQESVAPHELEIVTKAGHLVALEISTHIISRDGVLLGVQGIARDITERKKTEEALQQAKQNLEAWVDELEQRTREMTLLSEMGDMLRACLTTDEAYTVIVRVAQQLFPGRDGALYVITSSRNLVEAVAVWGDASSLERVFPPDECWALRRGRVHWVEDSSLGLLCKHLPHPSPEGYLCVPMMAQSEALGILYLSQPANLRLTEAKQRLAVAMAEHIAMAAVQFEAA